MYRITLLFCLFSCAPSLYSQHVIVSPEISIRNRIAYHLIGQVDDQILFYTEQGNERDVAVYDENLVFESERQVNLDKERASVYEVINLDTAFAIIYSYREEDEEIYKLDKFSATAVRSDSIVISRKERKLFKNEISSVLSEDKTKVTLYHIAGKDEIHFITIDVITGAVILDKTYAFTNHNLYDDLQQVVLGDNGVLHLLFEKHNYKNRKKKHEAIIYQIVGNDELVKEISIPLTDLICQDLSLHINNANGVIGLAGLFDEKKETKSSGYFWLSGSYEELKNKQVEFYNFPKSILLEVLGGRSDDRIDGLRVADVFWKNDSNPILALEISYDVLRQISRMTNEGQRFGAGGWSDHYREDLILISLDQNNQEEWTQVLYKKQFSQNDKGVFSSFFPFVTKSRLRLIYNDEIKSNSTVSEYILDSNGNYKRTSVLSTEYQNLRLRFADAIQISPTALLVPSQKSYDVNIVKIDFSE